MSISVNRFHGKGFTACEGYDTGNILGLKFNVFDVNGAPGGTNAQAVVTIRDAQHIGGGLYRTIGPTPSTIKVVSPIASFDGVIDNCDYQLNTLAELGLPPDPAWEHEPNHLFLTNLACEGIDDGFPFFLQCFNFGAQMVGSAVFPFTTSNPLITVYRPLVPGAVRGWRKINQAVAEGPEWPE